MFGGESRKEYAYEGKEHHDVVAGCLVGLSGSVQAVDIRAQGWLPSPGHEHPVCQSPPSGELNGISRNAQTFS
jgi:hypothetical protein